MKRHRTPVIALLGAAALAAAGPAAAATVALDASAGFRFSVVDVAFALPVGAAPVLGLDYELTITEEAPVEQRGAIGGPASANLSVTSSVGDMGGEGAVDVSVRGESPAGQANFTFGSAITRITLRQLGDFAVALTLDYVLEASLSVQIDNPGAAVDRANAFGDAAARISAFGFEDVLSDEVAVGFNNFSDFAPTEGVDIDRSRGGQTQRLTLVNTSGRPRSDILFSASAGGQVLLGDREPVAPPVAPIPLPAAGWMLLAGLGALAALRRRRG